MRNYDILKILKKRGIAVLLDAAGGLLLLGGCGIIGRQDETVPQYVFTYAENQTSDYPTTRGANRFADLVKEKSGGKIEIRIYPNAELGDENSAAEQLQFGGVDFMRASLSTVNSLSNESIVLEMPYLYNDSDHMWRVLDGEIGQEMLDSFEGSGAVALSWYDAGVRNFYTVDHPINSLSDLKGLKIRVQESDIMEDFINALGAEAVPIPYENVFSALQTGVIDGAENNWNSYEAMRHYEVAKYFTLDEHMRVPELQLASEVTWKKLNPEQQELIRACAKESAEYEREAWKEQSERAEEKAGSEGTVTIVLSSEEKERFRKASTPLYDKYCADYMDLIQKIQQS